MSRPYKKYYKEVGRAHSPAPRHGLHRSLELATVAQGARAHLGACLPEPRWHKTLAKCDCTVVYVPRRDNAVADCLSRWAHSASKGMTDVSAHGDGLRPLKTRRPSSCSAIEEEGLKCFVVMAADAPLSVRVLRAVRAKLAEAVSSYKPLFPGLCLQDDWMDDCTKLEAW